MLLLPEHLTLLLYGRAHEHGVALPSTKETLSGGTETARPRYVALMACPAVFCRKAAAPYSKASSCFQPSTAGASARGTAGAPISASLMAASAPCMRARCERFGSFGSVSLCRLLPSA